MGLFTKDIRTLNDLFVHQLKDLYYAENRIAKSLPDMTRKATNPELKRGFALQLAQTEASIDNVIEVFRLHGVEVEAVTCPAIDGILKEAEEVASEVGDKKVLDAALIAATHAIEHYVMTRYATLIGWACKLGRGDCASILEKNLKGEEDTDAKLTRLAEAEIDRLAA